VQNDLSAVKLQRKLIFLRSSDTKPIWCDLEVQRFEVLAEDEWEAKLSEILQAQVRRSQKIAASFFSFTPVNHSQRESFSWEGMERTMPRTFWGT
jgi:hypothetical protein